MKKETSKKRVVLKISLSLSHIIHFCFSIIEKKESKSLAGNPATIISSSFSFSPLSPPPMNNPNPNIPNPPLPNQNHACASCRYQRRKCNRDCPLAPYFPPDAQTKFLNAHKLFGVGNLLKMIRSLPDPEERDMAMETMMIQSDLRAKDPVLGCVGVIMNLQAQIAIHQNELNLIRHHMASIHAHQSALMMNPNPIPNHGFVNDVDVVAAAAHDHYLNQPQQLQLQLEHQGGGEGYEGILGNQESGGGGGENGNFQQDLNNEQQWRMMNENINETGLIEYGTGGNGMGNMMMMMKEEEVQVGEDALVPVLEERQFFDGFDRSNETNIGSSSETIPKVEEPNSIVQNEEQAIRKECSDDSSIKGEETTNYFKHEN